ncbi:MAG: LuxR C-terminal-related transcriptional regulator [Lapillicoccus sp.]
MRLNRPPPTYVGRVPERLRLQTLVRQARRGPVVAAVIGEAGVGKSALIAEVLRGEPDLLLLSGGGIAIPGLEALQSPFGVFSEALRGVRADPRVGPSVVRLIDSWVRPHSAPRGELDTVGRRHEELLAIFEKLAHGRTCVLVIEDLHWTDPSSLGALVFLARQVANETMAIVVTSRPPSTGATHSAVHVSVMEQIARLEYSSRIDVGPLTADESIELARSHGALDLVELGMITELAEGNPLAIIEMATASNLGQGVSPPPSVEAAVRDQWFAVDDDTRRILSAASVIGHHVPHQLLVSVVGPSSVDEVRATTSALTTGLLMLDGAGYRFRHVLDQQSLYSLVLPAEKLRLHRAVAQALSAHTDPGDRQLAAQIAVHWTAAGDTEMSTKANVIAGNVALDVGAFAESLDHLGRGVRGWVTCGGRADLLPIEPQTLALAIFEASRAIDELLRGIKLLDLLSPYYHGDDLALLYSWAAHLHRYHGDRPNCLRSHERALAVAVSPRIHGKVCASYASSTIIIGPRSVARLMNDQAFAELDINDHEGLFEAHEIRAWLLVGSRDSNAVIRSLETSRYHADQSGQDRLVWLILSNSTLIYAAVGLMARAVVAANEIISMARRRGMVRSGPMNMAISSAVEVLVGAGRWDEVLTIMDEALGDTLPDGEIESSVLVAKASVLVHRGDEKGVGVLLEHLIRVSRGWPQLGVELPCLSATSNMTMGRFDAALLTLEDSVDDWFKDAETLLINPGWLFDAFMTTATCSMSPTHRTRASVLLAQLSCFLDLLEISAGGTSALAEAVLLSARCEVARSATSDSAHEWREAAESWTTLGNPFKEAYCRLRQGEAALRRGDRRQAATALRRARLRAEELGAVPLLSAVVAAVRRARLPGKGDVQTNERGGLPARAAALSLTGRECEVLEGLLNGWTNREIARSLVISERTVGVHVSHVLSKLEVASRAQAAAKAHALHLLES